ncbi:MAG: HAMP domain-containing protein [Proteobacteria bacterium]|nr:HAMP domain-containing protein [Pseudomonadota bacterium]
MVRFITLISRVIKKLFLGNKVLPAFIRYSSAILMVGTVVLLGFSLLAILKGDIGHSENQLALVNINFLLIAIVLIVFIRYCLYLFIYRRKDLSKIRLNSRLAGVFCILAFVPGIAVLCFSLIFINSGVETWFSSRVTRSLDHSLKVAQAYLQEYEERLLIEAKDLAKDPIFSAPSFLIDSYAIKDVLIEEQKERNLAELSLYDSKGNLTDFSGDLIPSLQSSDITSAFEANILDSKGVIHKEENNNRITAIAKLPYDSGYLVIRRWVHPSVLYYLDSTQEAYQEYYQLRSERNQVKLLFSLFFGMFSIFLICGSVFVSIRLARRIIHPLESLIDGTKKIAEGQLDTKLNVVDNDEIGELTDAFNIMTTEIKDRQKELQARHKEIQQRRKTLEAVLTGVSSGVMTLNTQGTVRLANKTATETFNLKIGQNIKDEAPKIFQLVESYLNESKSWKISQDQIKISFEDVTKEFLVRVICLDSYKGKIKTVLITFDDITALHSAQKLGAWSDVARKMAHEIKNPLTPIQLSAERLKRRFATQVTKDNQLFVDLTGIIIRQVEDLRSLVNEFSDFARMPSPVFEPVNFVSLIKEIVLLQGNRDNIGLNLDVSEKNIPLSCDATQIKRVLTNLMENSINAIEENNKNSAGAIDIVAKISQNGDVELKIIDDGPGVPDDVDVNSLFDPYITTRKKGTGLGLAIVRKIIEEHKGSVRLLRRKPKGTIISIILPLKTLSED